ncbi:MAG: hypothetical protein MI924_02120 [Chloroflexales bacterium]|nr:hypothetical protein [Chloroflexales bacterium]
MTDTFSLRARCVALVMILSTDLNWNLSKAQQDAYVDALVQLIPTDRSWLQMRDLVVRYHNDHPLVESVQRLDQEADRGHWTHWVDETIDRLQEERFSHDASIANSKSELATVSLNALSQALPTYRYTTPFIVWAADVIGAVLQEYVSHMPAAKQQGSWRSREV